MFGEEYTLVAVADYILSHQKGNTVSNLSSTRALRDVTEKHKGEYFASAVGEVNVVTMMKAQNAVIGGEGNGGIIYPALHYGRDAMVGIALFLSHLAVSSKPASFLRGSYPNYTIAKNKITLTPDIDLDSLFASIEAKYKKQPINTIDGLKIEFDKRLDSFAPLEYRADCADLCRKPLGSHGRKFGGKDKSDVAMWLKGEAI